jgi:putative ABC transport system permease protein
MSMMPLTARLAWQSLWNRRLATSLTVLSVLLSVALLLGVERVRLGARDSFTGTISKTDLIVGARGGTIQLLLYAVFRMGSATGNISYETFQKIAARPDVAWTIPYSLGDSHRGFRVVGTTAAFYEHYRYRRDGQVAFKGGQAPAGMFDVTLGSAVAQKLGYKLGDRIVLAHGVSDVSFQQHDDRPFTVTGILAPTATPIDRSLYITLQGLEALHVDWTDGAPPTADKVTPAEALAAKELPVHQVTAVLVGAKSRIDTLKIQREINDDRDEPLMAVIPGVALSELWDGISYAEDGLRVVSIFVVIVGLIGMLVSIYNSLNERRREMAILRSIGAGPGLIVRLMLAESLLITTLGAALGVGTVYALLAALQPLIETHFGLYIPIQALSGAEYGYLGAILVLGSLLGFVPAWRAYRNTLADGLTVRL